MEKLRKLLIENLNEFLMLLVISGPRNKEDAVRIRVRPVRYKGRLVFQASSQIGKKEFHENLTQEQAADKICGWMENSYRQLHLETTEKTAQVLVSKKGLITIKEKKKAVPGKVVGDLSHNRKKRYLLEEGRPVPFLQDLGVMTEEGKIVHARYDKFRQINRFLEFIEDVLPKLDKNRENVILDFGCGKSYLTFAMYYYLKELRGYPVRIIGLDLKEDVICTCSRLAEKYGYENLTFLTGDIASYEGVDHVDMVVTLHACDTATDYALYKAVKWGAKVILSVPCCQHELNAQMKSERFAPLFQYGIIKERTAALFTDALRAQLLESQGYRVQILEFIDMEHTPKNLLIRAVKQGKKKENRKEIEAILEAIHAEPTLYRLLLEKNPNV